MIAMRYCRPTCCAGAACGHIAAAPPRSVMNSRRLMLDPRIKRTHHNDETQYFHRGQTGVAVARARCSGQTSKFRGDQRTSYFGLKSEQPIR